jgi:tetratricopeptide (TPR) repeat protein
MDLEKHSSFATAFSKICLIGPVCCVLLLLSDALPSVAQTPNSRKPELIRDTDIAEGNNGVDTTKPKEPNPVLAEQNVNIGNFYFKKKNYAAAIQRYLEALEYQPNSTRACEALARAYGKNSETAKAISIYKSLIEKNPDSPKIPDFRKKLSEIEKKSKP